MASTAGQESKPFAEALAPVKIEWPRLWRPHVFEITGAVYVWTQPAVSLAEAGRQELI